MRPPTSATEFMCMRTWKASPKRIMTRASFPLMETSPRLFRGSTKQMSYVTLWTLEMGRNALMLNYEVRPQKSATVNPQGQSSQKPPILAAHFEQNIVDVHCRRVVFCASADNGYARILGPHRGSRYISLVRGPPFAHEMKELAADFETTSFDQIFLSDKLRPTRRVSFSSQVQHTVITPPQSPTPNYASAAKSAPTPSPPTSSTNAFSAKPPRARLPVCVNARGHRIDRPIQYSSKVNVDSLKQKKLCNKYHLTGSCPYGDNCTHNHGPKLNSQQLNDLVFLARLSPCHGDVYCKDVDCISGHRCPRDTCSGLGCRFPDSMHSVDTTIVMNI